MSGAAKQPPVQHQVPDFIRVQARVLARSASRVKGLRVYSLAIASAVGYRLGLLRIVGFTLSVASLFGFGYPTKSLIGAITSGRSR